MATIVANAIASPSLATTLVPASNMLGPYYAGEAIAAGAPCYIKASDSKVYNSNGTAATAPAKVDGWCVKDTEIGRPITLYYHVVLTYGTPTSPAPGVRLFVSATAGSLDDAATTGGTASVATALPPPANTSPAMGFIFVKQSSY